MWITPEWPDEGKERKKKGKETYTITCVELKKMFSFSIIRTNNNLFPSPPSSHLMRNATLTTHLYLLVFFLFFRFFFHMSSSNLNYQRWITSSCFHWNVNHYIWSLWPERMNPHSHKMERTFTRRGGGGWLLTPPEPKKVKRPSDWEIEPVGSWSKHRYLHSPHCQGPHLKEKNRIHIGVNPWSRSFVKEGRWLVTGWSRRRVVSYCICR